MHAVTATNESERRRAARRTALWLAALAGAFYLGFILISIVRGSH
jgi:fatty acid desaturase